MIAEALGVVLYIERRPSILADDAGFDQYLQHRIENTEKPEERKADRIVQLCIDSQAFRSPGYRCHLKSYPSENTDTLKSITAELHCQSLRQMRRCLLPILVNVDENDLCRIAEINNDAY